MMEMMISEGHGERRILENILKGDDVVSGDKRDDIKASVTIER